MSHYDDLLAGAAEKMPRLFSAIPKRPLGFDSYNDMEKHAPYKLMSMAEKGIQAYACRSVSDSEADRITVFFDNVPIIQKQGFRHIIWCISELIGLDCETLKPGGCATEVEPPIYEILMRADYVVLMTSELYNACQFNAVMDSDSKRGIRNDEFDSVTKLSDRELYYCEFYLFQPGYPPSHHDVFAFEGHSKDMIDFINRADPLRSSYHVPPAFLK